jgi:glycosyltransferase involved in cell wall biosynthesis
MIGPFISVIIPTYNRAKLLPQAIESALVQTYPHYEIVIVDDGSTDETSEIIKPYINKVRFITQKNRGVSAARNRGIREAKGELIAFLDSDDLWLPNALRNKVQYLNMHPDTGLIHSDMLLLDEYGGTSGKSDPLMTNTGECYLGLFAGNRIFTSSVIVRRNCLEKAGDFDESIRYAEDYDLWIRLARECRFAYCEESLGFYRVHKSNAVKDLVRLREGELYVLRKALKADHLLGRRLGRKNVRSRLFKIKYDLGYSYFTLGRNDDARHLYIQALMLRPRARIIFNIMTTYLPSGSIGWLRNQRDKLQNQMAGGKTRPSE